MYVQMYEYVYLRSTGDYTLRPLHMIMFVDDTLSLSPRISIQLRLNNDYMAGVLLSQHR